MNKKGIAEKTLWFAIEAVLAILFVTAMMTYVTRVKNNDFHEKRHLAIDQALMYNAIQLANGKLTYAYAPKNFNLSTYTIIFSGNKASIEPFYYATMNSVQQLRNNIIQQKSAYTITKNGNTISFNERDEPQHYTTCPPLQQKTFTLTQPYTQNTVDYSEMKSLIAQIRSHNNQQFIEAPTTQTITTITLAKNDQTNTTIIYFDATTHPSLYPLACTLRNILLSYEGTPTVQIIPLIPTHEHDTALTIHANDSVLITLPKNTGLADYTTLGETIARITNTA